MDIKRRQRGQDQRKCWKAKPRVAYSNEFAATQNLYNKLAVLESWAVNGIPVMQAEVGPVLDGERRQGAEYFPRTVRQFNGWDGSQNSRSALRPFEAFKVNANVTLRKRSDILERVVAVIKNLRNQQESTPRRAQPDTHAVLKERLAREVLMRAQLEEALIHLKRENKQLARENDGLKTQRDSIKQEARRAVKRLELRLARVELERKTQE